MAESDFSKTSTALKIGDIIIVEGRVAASSMSGAMSKTVNISGFTAAPKGDRLPDLYHERGERLHGFNLCQACQRHAV